MATVLNPYANQDLFWPSEFHQNHVKALQGRGDVRKPFQRQIDLWWCALCLGVKIGQRTRLGPKAKLVKFNDGGILSSDPWRITHLELLALAEFGEEGLDNPSGTIQMASEYAATGARVIGEICMGAAEPTLTLLTQLPDYLETA
ncbi:MAG: hypothetical protein F4Z59_02660 [Gemmatimonadales bacterium]|nr:hypothetical protein [Gemmatimonadales bacterium]MYA17711.1 hypothetical protein [Gammaproteobacteria bacterium]